MIWNRLHTILNVDFSHTDKVSRNSYADTCAICREDLVYGTSCIKKLPCSHLFHLACLRGWVEHQVGRVVWKRGPWYYLIKLYVFREEVSSYMINLHGFLRLVRQYLRTWRIRLKALTCPAILSLSPQTTCPTCRLSLESQPATETLENKDLVGILSSLFWLLKQYLQNIFPQFTAARLQVALQENNNNVERAAGALLQSVCGLSSCFVVLKDDSA